MKGFIVVFVTVGSRKEGQRLARVLVEERLAACVSRVGGVRSIYRWQGQLEESKEELLVIKTQQRLFNNLRKRVQALHGYAEPEIIALPVLDGSPSYLKWLGEQLRTEEE